MEGPVSFLSAIKSIKTNKMVPVQSDFQFSDPGAQQMLCTMFTDGACTIRRASNASKASTAINTYHIHNNQSGNDVYALVINDDWLITGIIDGMHFVKTNTYQSLQSLQSPQSPQSLQSPQSPDYTNPQSIIDFAKN